MRVGPGSSRTRFGRLLLWAAPLGWLGCGGGGGTDIVLPSLSVSTTTSGVELDPDGYSLTVDAGTARPIGVNATLTVDQLSDGEHTVALAGLASNCTAGDNPRTVTVHSGSTTPVSFAITCNARTGNLEVSTVTTGDGTDSDGFELMLDASQWGPIGVSATVDLNGLTPGDHSLGLSGLAANCQLAGENPRTVSVAADQTTQISFSLTCSGGPSTGGIQITTATTGSSLDPDGYTTKVDDGTAQGIGINGSISVSNLAAGSHSVLLAGLASNCTVSGDNPRAAVVTAGQTASVQFAVSCVAVGSSVNLRIEDMYLTQSTQTLTGAVPLVKDRKAFLRVFAVANQSNSVAPTVRVRFFRNGGVIRTLTINSPGSSTPTSVAEGSLSSSWNQAVDAELVQPGVSVVADVDPDNQIAESDEGDNSFPASGTPQNLTVHSESVVKIRFVPIKQGSAPAGNVSAANKDQLVEMAKRMYPLNTVETDVREVWTVGENVLQPDGTGWNQTLSDLEGIRVMEGSDRTYYGVARLSYQSGIVGIGFVGVPSAMGTDSPSDVRRVLAHELGHTWNQLHTPCGGPPNIDPFYPYGLGIGVYGYDVANNSLKPPITPDIMGYCPNPWISDYIYKRVMTYRENNPAPIQSASRQSSVLVWGRIVNGQPVLEPAFQVVTRPSLPAKPGPYSIEALAVDGTSLFRLSFDAPEVADDPSRSRPFAFAVPLDQARAARLGSLRAATPHGAAAVTSQSVARLQPGSVPEKIVARREGGAVALEWNASTHPMIMVRDPDTGEVLSFARGGKARVWTSKAAVDLEVSDGVRSQRERLAISRP